jgi:hypothetical protein
MIYDKVHLDMKIYGGSGVVASPISTSALDGGEWSASRPGRFISGNMGFGTHCTGTGLSYSV